MTTAATLIKDAMIDIGACGAVDSPDPDDSALALRMVNRMLDSWALRGLYAYHTRWEQVSLTAAMGSRTIGPGGQINTTRPVGVSTGGFSRVGGIDKELLVASRDQWAGIEGKALISERPAFVYYEASSPLGAAHFWPRSDSTVFLALETVITAFADQTTDYAFPPGYEDAIVKSLSERLCAPFSRPVPDTLRSDAALARKAIKRANYSVPELSIPPGGRRFGGLTEFVAG